jgi:hypothetical protein
MNAIMQFIVSNIEMLYILTFAIFFGDGGDIKSANSASHTTDVRSECN